MRLAFFFTLLAVLVSNVQAGIITSTYSWPSGDTIVVSMTTNPNGVAQTSIVSIVGAGAANPINTGLTTSRRSTTSATAAATRASPAKTPGASAQATTSMPIATTVVTGAGVTVTIESGTTLDYAGFSSIVGPSLQAAYSATASSSASRQFVLPSWPVVLSVSSAVLGGTLGAVSLFI